MDTGRRRFIGLTASLATIGIAGCTGPGIEKEEPQTNNDDEEVPDDLDVENPEPVSQQEFDNWEPDTNCSDDQPESMLNSEIGVKAVLENLPEEYDPISYDSLPHSQKELLAITLTEGGYATCEESDAFSTFLQNAVETTRNQEGDDSHAYLEYDGAYYQLYLRRADQVYTY